MRTIRIEEMAASTTLYEFFQSLELRSEDLVVEFGGKPLVVVCSPKVIEMREQAKRDLASIMARIRARNPELNSDDVLEGLEALDMSS